MTETQKLREALQEAATSLETISRLAGKSVYPNGDSTYMGTFADVRGHATSRASVARAALAMPTEPSALDRYKASTIEQDESSPVERLRYFLSLALKDSQDWLDVEPFLDALKPSQPVALPDERGQFDIDSARLFLASFANWKPDPFNDDKHYRALQTALDYLDDLIGPQARAAAAQAQGGKV